MSRKKSTAKIPPPPVEVEEGEEGESGSDVDDFDDEDELTRMDDEEEEGGPSVPDIVVPTKKSAEQVKMIVMPASLFGMIDVEPTPKKGKGKKETAPVKRGSAVVPAGDPTVMSPGETPEYHEKFEDYLAKLSPLYVGHSKEKLETLAHLVTKRVVYDAKFGNEATEKEIVEAMGKLGLTGSTK